MDKTALKDTYLIRPDLHWDRLFDGAVLLRWGNNAQIVNSQAAEGLLGFLERFAGGSLSSGDLSGFASLDESLKELFRTQLLRETGDVLGNFKMPEWYSRIAVSLPNPRLKFMNHGYAELNDEDLGWVRPEDFEERYQVNLVRRLTEGVSLQGASVLDIGCGRGGAASYLARYHDTRDVTGMDFCGESVELCRRIYDIDGLGFRQGDAQDLPFEAESFDVVTNIESSHCYAAPKIFFQEVHRVLKKDGHFCYTDCFPAAPRFELIDRHLADAGFRVDACQDITDNVIAAIERGQESLAGLLRESSATGAETDNEAEHWYKGGVPAVRSLQERLPEIPALEPEQGLEPISKLRFMDM